ncbi:hypothetical protein DIPPA_00743 [Diplonema papillatum]|nr:hypothetical protein DIPPA_00743 [Diplonema papillatum]
MAQGGAAASRRPPAGPQPGSGCRRRGAVHGGIAGASPDRMVPVDRTGSSAFALPRRGFASSPGRSRTLSHVGGSPCLAADGIPSDSPLLHEGERSFWTSPHFNPTAMRSSADSPYSVAAFSEPNASPFAVSALSAAVSEEDDYWNRFVQRWEAQGAATQEAL